MASELSDAIAAADLDEASSLLEVQLREHPADLRALAQMTAVSMRRQDWRRALRSGAEEAKLQPDHLPVLKKQLMLLMKYGEDSHSTADFKASVDIATRIRALSPAGGPLLRLAGQVFAGAGLNREAVQALQLAASHDARDPITFAMLAEVFRRLGQQSQSAAALSEFVQLKPLDPVVWRALSSAWKRAGCDVEAKNAFARSVELRAPRVDPDFANGLAALTGYPVKISRERLGWAWRLQVEAGTTESIGARSEWDQRAQWSADADQLLLDWLEVYPERWQEVAERIEIEGLELLHDCTRAGKGRVCRDRASWPSDGHALRLAAIGPAIS